jgi:hypothetical protein
MKRYLSCIENIEDFDEQLAVLLDNGYEVNSLELFQEAVISPENHITEIIEKVRQLKKHFKTFGSRLDLNEIQRSLNKVLEFDKILFKYSPVNNERFITTGGINIKSQLIFIFYFSNLLTIANSEENFNNFILQFKEILGHELIHREQSLRIENEEIRNKMLTKSKADNKKYLGSKQEIMAYAWQIIYSFKLTGKSSSTIANILKADNIVKFKFNGMLKEYHKNFEINEDPLKLLYKYMYMYLEEN